jgi:tetratricopeptide (TPR) repeat protein
MRQRASTAACGLLLCLLPAQAGCSLGSLRRDDRGPASHQQALRVRQITERSQEAIDRGDYESARADLLQLATETPRSAEVQRRLGTIFQLEGRLPEAETSFREALKRDPDYVEALIGLGQVEAQKGDLASAVKRFETAIEIEPHRSKAHDCLARVHESTGAVDEALAEYFRALEFDPNNPDISVHIAAIQLAQQQPDQALARLDQVVELAPKIGEAHVLRGRAHLTLRHFSLAVDDFRTAISKLQPRADVYYYLALALEADHKPADALRAAQQALRIAPSFADAQGLSQRLALAAEPPVRPSARPRIPDREPPAEPPR